MTSRDAISLEQITNRFTRRHIRRPSSGKRLLISSPGKRGWNRSYRHVYRATRYARRPSLLCNNVVTRNEIKCSKISTAEYPLSVAYDLSLIRTATFKNSSCSRAFCLNTNYSSTYFEHENDKDTGGERKNRIINEDVIIPLAVGYLFFFYL